MVQQERMAYIQGTMSVYHASLAHQDVFLGWCRCMPCTPPSSGMAPCPAAFSISTRPWRTEPPKEHLAWCYLSDVGRWTGKANSQSIAFIQDYRC